MTESHTKGIHLAIITALISGVAIFVNKFAVGAISPPLVFTATKNTGVGLLIISIIFATKKWKLIGKLNRREILYLLSIGIVGGSIPFYLFFTGLSAIPAINAAIIHKTLIFWVALLAIPILGEKLSKDQIIAILLLFAGNVFVGGFEGFKFSTGEFMILAATILWAIENVLAKRILSSVDPDILTTARMGFGSIVLLTAALITAPSQVLGVLSLTPTQWFWMVLTIATLLGYVTSWYRALKYASATTVASVLVGSTLITNVLSAIFVTHVWTPSMGIQSLLITVGVGIFWHAAKKEISEASRSKLSIEAAD